MATNSATKSFDQSEGLGLKKQEALDDMLRRLGIDKDEIDDLIFEDEEEAPKEGIKWPALARVHTTKFFSHQTFEQHMKTAWSPTKEVTNKALEANLFTIQAYGRLAEDRARKAMALPSEHSYNCSL
jgi:hypothetical protein